MSRVSQGAVHRQCTLAASGLLRSAASANQARSCAAAAGNAPPSPNAAAICCRAEGGCQTAGSCTPRRSIQRCSRPGSASTSVSYTHLDVYKRQVSEWLNGLLATELADGSLLPSVALVGVAEADFVPGVMG